MTMQRTLLIISFACAATTGAACGLTGGGDASTPDADMGKPPVLPRSCKELFDANPALDSGAYTLGTAAGASYQAYCDMEDDSGGWTLVLKVDGTAKDSQFGYDSPMWTNSMTLKDDKVDASRVEAKFRSFSEVAFTQLRLVMAANQTAAMTLNATGTSLSSLMRGPFVQLAPQRDQWMSLMGLTDPKALQPSCDRSGINNFAADPSIRIRIGFTADSDPRCMVRDSFLGIGGGGGLENPCYGAAFVPPAAGVIGGGSCGVGPTTPAFAYVYVR